MLEASLNRDAYVSNDVWAKEQHKVFASNWVCVARQLEIAEVSGSYRLVDLQGEQVLVVRGADTKLRAFVNMCRHRGTELVDSTDLNAAQGCFGALIKCPYHSWTYNVDGSLRGAPYLDDLDFSNHSLLQLELDIWGGYVFVRQIPNKKSLKDSLGAIAGRVKNYPLSELVSAKTFTYQVGANWKVLAENYNECYHCGPVHPELCDLVPSFRQGGGSDLDWIDGVPHREGAYTFTSSGTTTRKPFAGLSAAELVNHKGELVYPNLWLSLACDHVASFVLWPNGPAHTTIVFDLLFHPDQIAQLDFDPSDAFDFWHVVNLQDWNICERVQRGMTSKFFTQGLFAKMENPSLDIREWWRTEMGEK